MSRLLVVNDDLQYSESLAKMLSDGGYKVDCVCNAESALAHQKKLPAELVILHMPFANAETLPLISDICDGFATPILVLASPSEQQYMLSALRAGADKYLLNTYTDDALLVSINVLLRRVELEKQRLAFHHCNQLFSLKVSRLPLTETETQLVQFLSKNNGMTISKATLQKEVLKKELCIFDRNLDMHISNIRRKMLQGGLSKLHIKTVHGKGYVFSDSVA